MDIVGYSTRLINEQRTLRDALNQIVRATDQFRHADSEGSLIKSPTGDGMALVFRRSVRSQSSAGDETFTGNNPTPRSMDQW
jgi:hypothetical protein